MAALRQQYQSYGELTSFTVPTTISSGDTPTLSASAQGDETTKTTEIPPQLPSSETLTERSSASIPLVTAEETEGEHLTTMTNVNEEEQNHRITVIPEEERINDMMNNNTD